MKAATKATALALGLVASPFIQAGEHEWRFGVLAHNKGPIASETEDGPDVTLAYYHHLKQYNWGGLFAHGGAVINTADGTSYLYSGLNPKWNFGESPVYFELGFGLAVHDGDLEKKSAERREMGSRVLFHTEFNLGYQINPLYSVGLYLDHISNGGILNDDNNRGLDTYGIRLGRRF